MTPFSRKGERVLGVLSPKYYVFLWLLHRYLVSVWPILGDESFFDEIKPPGLFVLDLCSDLWSGRMGFSLFHLCDASLTAPI